MVFLVLVFLILFYLFCFKTPLEKEFKMKSEKKTEEKRRKKKGNNPWVWPRPIPSLACLTTPRSPAASAASSSGRTARGLPPSLGPTGAPSPFSPFTD
jgi:hypothetical protein